MSSKTVERVRDLVIAQYRKDFPGEALYGKVFSTYILEKYCKIIYKLHKQAEKKRQE